MGIEIPGALRTVAAVAVGQEWPEADEASLRRLADAWGTVANTVTALGADGDSAMQFALAGLIGDANDAMAGYWDTVGGDSGVMAELAAVCRQLADSCETTAADVEEAKLAIIAALIALAAEIAALTASAVATFGASTAGIPIAELATQATVRIILAELFQKMLQQALIGAVKEVAITGGIQVVQTVQGNRDGLDLGDLARSAGSGAIGGAVSAGLGRDGGYGGLLVDKVEGAAAKGATSIAVDAAVGAAGATVGDIATGQGASWDSAGRGAAEGVLGGQRASTQPGAADPSTTPSPTPSGSGSLNMGP
ncbi:hypothetical protein ERC79_07095 [Rhodococcus sp. ABRD24]|uniref:WXG100-like domain-containing protein n=1 Tax=Rhodococcus sp. ABRD24 TaxID=2507582 RepID=UPI00103F6074|nr:hypothetical protein [Rhodococcus sp. ABRD24]QBJ95754.1 hypothetical protein ERC79_07095 [Rhodococcus sp. ABRD24]